MWISKRLAIAVLGIVVLLGATDAQAQNYSDPIAPNFSVGIQPEDGHFIDENFGFDESDAAGLAVLFDFNRDGIPDSLHTNFDDLRPEEDFPWTYVHVASSWGTGENLGVGTFNNATNDNRGTGNGRTVDMGFDHTTCDDVGVFQILALDYERKNFGSEDSPNWAFHVTSLDLDYVTSCNDEDGPRVRIRITYTDTARGDGDGNGDGGGTPPPPPPPTPTFQLQLPADFDTTPLVLNNGSSTSIKLTSLVSSTFNADLHLSATSNAAEHENFQVGISPAMIAAPGGGDATLTITTGPMTFPGQYTVTLTAISGDQVFNLPLLVEVYCDPPFILGTNQPQSTTAVSGATFNMHVTPNGSGPFLYQWYRGMPGMTWSPVEGATSATLSTSTRESGPYWVRVSNACGSVDSQAGFVSTTSNLRLPSRSGKR